MRLVVSRLALAELDEILGFVAERSPLGAAHAEAHEADPRSDRASSGGRAAPGATPRCPAAVARFPYVIYYEVAKDQVTVLRILHGAREQPWDEGGLKEPR